MSWGAEWMGVGGGGQTKKECTRRSIQTHTPTHTHVHTIYARTHTRIGIRTHIHGHIVIIGQHLPAATAAHETAAIKGRVDLSFVVVVFAPHWLDPQTAAGAVL